MAANLTEYDAVLKENYAPAIIEQLNSKTILLKRLERDRDSFNGEHFVIPLHTAWNEGIGARTESGTRPTAGQQGYKRALYSEVYNFGSIKLTQALISKTRKTKGSFVKAVRSEVEGMTKGFIQDTNRQLNRSKTGLLGTCGTTANSTTVVMGSDNDMKFLRVNMSVDILVKADGTTGTGGTNRTITAINKANKTITISGAAITTDNTYGVYRTGNYNLEMNGLEDIVAESGALGNLNPANAGEEAWAAHVFDNGGTLRSISDDLVLVAYESVSEDSNGEVSLVLSSFGVRRAYVKLQRSLKRHVNTKVVDGGFKVIEYEGVDWAVDKAHTPNTMRFLDMDNLKLCEVEEAQWMDEDGHILKWDTNTGYEAVFYHFANFVTGLRSAHASLGDITEVNG